MKLKVARPSDKFAKLATLDMSWCGHVENMVDEGFVNSVQ